MTLDQIKERAEKELIARNWKSIRKSGYSLYTRRPFQTPYKDIKVTGFDIQYLKDINGENTWFLIEFYPTGSFHGLTNQPSSGNLKGFYSDYPSIFKVLGIEKDNRYCDYFHLATMINGRLISLDDEQGRLAMQAGWDDALDGHGIEHRDRQIVEIRGKEGNIVYSYETQKWENEIFTEEEVENYFINKSSMKMASLTENTLVTLGDKTQKPIQE